MMCYIIREKACMSIILTYLQRHLHMAKNVKKQFVQSTLFILIIAKKSNNFKDSSVNMI